MLKSPGSLSSKTLVRMIIGIATLINLGACTFDLDDPTGSQGRRAQERQAECQQVYALDQANYEQVLAIYTQDGFSVDQKLTQAGFLEEAEIYLNRAQALEALDLDDYNLELLSSYLAGSLRHQAQRSRDLAPFAAVERAITSANDRSLAHQAVVARINPYNGGRYILELYCQGREFDGNWTWELQE